MTGAGDRQWRGRRSTRRLLGGVRETWSLMVLSLALSVALWAFVTVEENPRRTDLFPSRISVEAVNVPDGLAISGGTSLGGVSIRVSAREDVFRDLEPGDFRAVVDLAGAGQGTFEAPVEVQVVDEGMRKDVSVVDVTPSTISVSLEILVSETVPVRVNITGQPPLGFEASAPVVAPAEVTVSGPEALVRQVAQVEADVNLSGATVDLTRTFRLSPRSAGGGTIDGVRVQPDSAVVSVTIRQTVFERVVVVRPSVSGLAASGFQITGIDVSPPQVVVVGTLEALQALLYAETEDVDIGGATSTVTRTALLKLPPDVSAPGQSSVIVTVSVAAARGEAEFSVVPEVVSLPDGLRSTVNLVSMTVRVEGDLPALRVLRARDIRAIVDGSGLQPGVYSVRPEFVLPEGITLRSYGPTEVIVTVVRE